MGHQHSESTEITYHHAPGGDEVKKRIFKTTWILSIITIIELSLGFAIYFLHQDPNHSHTLVLTIKGIVVILSLAKAFYIVSIFMHLGDELKNMIMTIAVPLLLFIWFIAAFLWDGGSYKNLKNKYDPHHKEQSTKVVQPATHEKEEQHHAVPKPTDLK
jgi:cytochrome c oxidase subunit IV